MRLWIQFLPYKLMILSTGRYSINWHESSLVARFGLTNSLNCEIFQNGKEAQTIVEAWRQEYNNYRPHSSLGYLTPDEFARRYYEKNKEKQAIQPREKAGSLSL